MMPDAAMVLLDTLGEGALVLLAFCAVAHFWREMSRQAAEMDDGNAG